MSTVEWGVNGHPLVAYPGVSSEQQLQLVHQMGLTSYRVDVYDTSASSMSQLSTLISEGKALGVSILPVLNMDPNAFSSETAAYNAAYAMASTYAKAFPGMTWELTNELDIPSMTSGTSGQNTSDYNTTTYTMSRGLINGMYSGIHQADPTSLGVVDNAGWFHFGFLDKLAADGVKWDITAEHWYSDYGSMTNVGGSGTDALANLAALGHPIEITEFNENEGSARDGTQAEANYLTTTMQQVDSIAAKYNITAGYIYELLDDPRLPNYGLADASGNLKAAGTAVENFLAANPSAPGFPTGSAGGSPAPAPAPSPSPAPSSSGSTTGTGPDKLVLHLSEDAWSGDAQFSVSVDGKQLATGQSVTASHAAGQTEDFTYNGTFGSGPHTVAVTFLNDGYGGSAASDRNLYVNGFDYDGQHSSATAALQTTGAVDSFTVTTPTPTPTPAPAPAPAPSSGAVIANPDAHATPVETRSYVVADSTGTAHGTSGANDLYTTADGQTLIGGGGDDVFHISSNVNSHIVVGSSGVTTVSTYAVHYTLAAGVNNLQLQGNYAHVATGNGLANYITGSDGNDTIHGGGGNDTIAVGTGANTLTGGGQHDLFVFSKAADHGNVVTDFHVGQDMLDLRAMMKDAGYTGADPIADHTLSLTQHGADTSIDLTVHGASHTVVTLQNVAANALHAGQDYLGH
jgi:Ca2+-binding RTX toxin-like protein